MWNNSDRIPTDHQQTISFSQSCKKDHHATRKDKRELKKKKKKKNWDRTHASGSSERGKVCSLCELSHVQPFVSPWIVARQALLSMGFSRLKYWRGLPFPSPGDLPDPGIEPGSPASQADSLPTELRGKPTRGASETTRSVQQA